MFLVILVAYLVSSAHVSTTHVLSVRDMNCTDVAEVCPEAENPSPEDLVSLVEQIALQEVEEGGEGGRDRMGGSPGRRLGRRGDLAHGPDVPRRFEEGSHGVDVGPAGVVSVGVVGGVVRRRG